MWYLLHMLADDEQVCLDHAERPEFDEWRWIDFAGTRHNDGCVLSFADGHSELWKWKESRTLEISKMKGWIQGQAGVYGKDRDLGRIYDAIPKIPL